MKGYGQWIVLAALLIMLPATATRGQVRPKKFCDCPDHKRPSAAASVSGGTTYRLYGYNDAFRLSLTEQWCYTRAVWFDRVSSSGRIVWRSSDNSDVLAGAVKESDDLCGA